MNRESMRSFWVTFAILVALLALVCFGGCPEAQAQPYPREGAYVGVRSGGSPLIRPDGTIDSAVCKQFARFRQVALDMNALLISPNIVPTLIHYRPEIEIAGYHLTTHWYLPASFVPQSGDKSFDAYWHQTIKGTGGFLAGAPEGYEVDWLKKATSDSLANLLVWGLERLRVTAYFGDYFSPMVKWAGIGNDFSDQARIQNMSEAVRRIRDSQRAGFRCYGNGTGAENCGLDGTLVEGFPNSLATGSFSRAIQQGNGDWLKSEGQFTDKRAFRFLLGTACMTGATTSYGAQEVSPGGQTWPGTWWFDEYSVTPDGKPDYTGAHVGWLGEALSPAIKMANGLYVRFFEHGLVIVNPTGSTISQAVLSPRWKRIGQTVADATLVIPATDALFLWGD